MAQKKQVTMDDVIRAGDRIAGHVHKTPVMTSAHIDHLAGRKIYFKCEHLQKTGSFKVRGAVNTILAHQERAAKKEESPLLGVVTHSSGNHGQSTAWAAHHLGVPSIVVVTEDTPKCKAAAINGYGAKLVFCKPTASERVKTCNQQAKETGFTYISSHNDYDVIAGQGTLGKDFLDEVPQLDAVLVTVCGGGLAAGVAIAMKSIKPSLKVYCVEPEGKLLEASLVAEKPLWDGEIKFVDTIADCIRIQQLGDKTFPIISQLCEKKVFTMTNEEMIEGMKLAFTRLKQVVEAAPGAALQAVIKYRDVIPSDVKHIGVIVCGGNVDIEKLPWVV